MNNIIKKLFATFLIVLLMFYSAGYPVISYADDISPTPTDTSTPTPTPTDTITPTPTPDTNQVAVISDSPTPTPPVTVDNSAVASTDATATSNTGDNNVTSGSPSGGPSKSDSPNSNSNSNSSGGASSIKTGDATSVTNVENEVNSTSTNSSIVMQTVNIFVDQNGNLDLSDPYTLAAQAIKSHPDDPVINLSVVNVSNFAYVTNIVTSTANTGNNTVDSSGGDSSINTGNAYSAVSLLNKVNLTIINSIIHVVTINVFGSLNGNIILPENSTAQNCTDCTTNSSSKNNAIVNNNVDSNADSGNNLASGDANITTGNAKSAINILNLINQNFSDSNIEYLYINILGAWDGSFMGWYEFGSQNGGTSLALSNEAGSSKSCDSCSDANISNLAIVNNNIVSSANTGGNKINGGNGKIGTGNAYSSISLFNFINSNFVNSSGFFGFLNIFGNWHGNIGGKKAMTQNAQDDQGNNSSQTNNSSSNLEKGGALTIDSTNNVGDHVNPGDTVTFFANVKNNGSGTVYGAKLNLHLIQDGVDVGGADFDLGDIPPGKTLHLSTGFVLSQTVNGHYTARATATGKVGPNGDSVSAVSDSFFNVLGTVVAAAGSAQVLSSADISNKSNHSSSYILPYSGSKPDSAVNFSTLWILFCTMTAYIALRLMRERKKLNLLFSNTERLSAKLRTLKMILL